MSASILGCPTQCPDCFLEYASCRCMPNAMKRARMEMLLKLTPYTESAGGRITRRAVLRMKKRPSERLLAYLAEELGAALRTALEEQRDREADRPAITTVLAWIPRSRKSVKRHGFDQAELLARAVAREAGLAAVPLLKRRFDGTQQKELSASARSRNLRGAFALNEDARGLRVILVDDVVTTGASMAEGARLLRRGGAHSIWGLCIATTERRMKRTP